MSESTTLPMNTVRTASSQTARTRDSNLDLLRASAILMVLVYHVTQRWPTPLPRLCAVTEYGKYGVDLFFVLSGWLIGGLLWREKGAFGNVQIGRFICRRMIRTAPPYLAALAISYLGVRIVRHEPFNWGYLFFLQNYYARIPYFLVSWSLCVEEHFYLAMPFIALGLTCRGTKGHLFIPVLACFPMVFRALETNGSDFAFGYHFTATHLRYEGLLLGVWASFLRERRAGDWATLRRIVPFALIAAIGLAMTTLFLSERGRYITVYFAVAVIFLLLLVLLVERRPVLWADSRIVFWIAFTSYSVYLVHAFTFDLALRVIHRMPSVALLDVCVIATFIGVSGALFYFAVERPSLALRRRLMPPRA